jgi:hypothetical protein
MGKQKSKLVLSFASMERPIFSEEKRAPKFAYELLGAIPPPKKGEPKPTGPEPGEPTTPTKGGPEAYESVSVTSDLDWKKWMEFHDARARRSDRSIRECYRGIYEERKVNASYAQVLNITYAQQLCQA